ncbi:conserved hypothetical protein [Candidatus Caldarchaeum subterraneum]|uniref:Uncharacterized protein n=1 Tax=Caldiarchaeum subterraneum TaxID=311458 RepID=E6N920_CALS0|nr:conserved hypothetical protein [Candidatus Caldarchaeum subterraneum]BAJ51445.1 conserved hypothetical protein [Candidatus Caldarchaeum subterraneum]
MPNWTLSKEPTPICNPLCRFFRCGKKVLDYRRNPPWCNWVDAPCIGYQCPYAQCIQVKLLPDGRCGLFVKRKTVEQENVLDLSSVSAAKAKKKLDRLGL